jgi:hypothetical protein
MKIPIPAAGQIATGETLVQFVTDPDDHGRRRFVAFWLDPAAPGGVRGQVFQTTLDEFTARTTQLGGTVREWAPASSASAR